MSDGRLFPVMNSPLLEAMLAAPDLPELIEQAQRAYMREKKLRQKFYEDITPEQKWEFIQGEVIMHSPALNRHLAASQRILSILGAFVRVNNLGLVRHQKAMTSFPRNDCEPDVMFLGTSKAALIDADTLRFPIPDLIIEVLSPSTEARDRGVKFQDYALHGVAEYWIVDAVAETLEAHRLAGNVYPPANRQSEGLVTSEVIPGLEVPVRAFFDEAENARVMRKIWAGT